MARVTVRLPTMLVMVTKGSAAVEVEGDTVGETLEALLAVHPELEVHIFDENRALRPHVLCFHNETNTRWLPDLQAVTRDGDTVTIMQAVSGG